MERAGVLAGEQMATDGLGPKIELHAETDATDHEVQVSPIARAFASMIAPEISGERAPSGFFGEVASGRASCGLPTTATWLDTGPIPGRPRGR